MTNHANGSSMPQIENVTITQSTSAAFNEAVLTGAAMAGGKQSYVEVDYELYEAMLDDPSMSKADKRLLIDTLWNIVTSFVELGFGVHPVQQAADARAAREQACGEGQNFLANEQGDSVGSEDTDNAPKTAEGGPE